MIRYFWSKSNGTNRPTVKYMGFEPSTEYYNGMPLKKNEAGAVMPTEGDPQYICLWDYQPDDDIRTLEIPVIEVFPDTIYEKWNEDGTVEEVRFGGGTGGGAILDSNGKLKNEVLPDGYPYDAGGFSYTNSVYKEGDELVGGFLFKVSDDTPSYEDLLGAKFITEGGAEPEGELTSDNTQYVEGEFTGAMIGFNRNIIVTYKDNYEFPDDESLIIPTKGVYMSVYANITIFKTTIVPMATEFLPKITIVEDGYADAAAGVMAAGAMGYTCTANVTFEELLQALQNKNVPMVELYYHGHGDGVIGVVKGGTTYLRVDIDGNIQIAQEFYINGGYLLVVWEANGEIRLIPQ